MYWTAGHTKHRHMEQCRTYQSMDTSTVVIFGYNLISCWEFYCRYKLSSLLALDVVKFFKNSQNYGTGGALLVNAKALHIFGNLLKLFRPLSSVKNYFSSSARKMPWSDSTDKWISDHSGTESPGVPQVKWL